MVELPRRLAGRVVSGDRRGRELGFPTANVDVPAADVPPDGVYAGRVRREDGSLYTAAVSIGRRPTYYTDDAIRLVEAYLLDFAGDLYGEQIEIELEYFLRGQVRFGSNEELVAQMEADVSAVRRLPASSSG